ncbi:NupC/NupG family nucleoside CNT transporter [Desertibaculum subflavum]|uniref:NupC/NupG family nucleoside CNT transporter n=1 Tax=Desertibaculum subflavum TaxID=2268458 RepID=UPI0034D2E1D0
MLQSLFGLLVLTALAWAMSERRSRVHWRAVGVGLGLQLALAALFLNVPVLQAGLASLNRAVNGLSEATRAGTGFVFGYLGGGPLPFQESFPGASFVLAFQALPLVLVISALSSLLFYWRILPLIVKGAAWALERTMGVGGAVGLSTAANIFVGMVEAPVFIRPYLKQVSRSELFVIMTGGMAGVAGTVMVIYANFMAATIPDAIGHILLCSVLTAPAAIVVALLMVPDEAPPTGAELQSPEPPSFSAMDAVTKGTLAGLELFLNIIAMLIVLVALVWLANAILGLLPDVAGAPITLQRILGLVMAPICWLMGIPWAEATTAGALMGTKTVLNEFIAYLELSRLPPEALSPRSRLIMLYGLCGFANFASLGIMIGGLTAMVPERRPEIVSLGLKTIVSGTLATCMSAAVVGIMI